MMLRRLQRFWVYEYDPNLPEHGYVRVTYKESVATVETADRPYEFKPVELVDGKYVTKKEGFIFMQDARYTPSEWCSHNDARFPSLSSNPGVDRHRRPHPHTAACAATPTCAATATRTQVLMIGSLVDLRSGCRIKRPGRRNAFFAIFWSIA